jgi:hypothetical protein
VICGLAYYGLEWIGEILNALWLRFSGHSAPWLEPGPTAYLMLVGINVETTLMFLFFGLVIAKLLPKDRALRVWRIPNRWLVVVGLSLFCVLVETTLNRWGGALTWDYRWWGWPNIWTVMLFAYGPAIAFTIWVHDLESWRLKVAVTGACWVLAASAWPCSSACAGFDRWPPDPELGVATALSRARSSSRRVVRWQGDGGRSQHKRTTCPWRRASSRRWARTSGRLFISARYDRASSSNAKPRPWS